jgi:hypothetical protein
VIPLWLSGFSKCDEPAGITTRAFEIQGAIGAMLTRSRKSNAVASGANVPYGIVEVLPDFCDLASHL